MFVENSHLPTESIDSLIVAMARVGSCFGPSFSPDGKQIAFVSTLSGIPQVWVQDLEGGWPRAVTALDDQVGSVHWSPDGSLLAFTLAPGGGMNSQIYVVRPDGTGMRRLSQGGRDNNWLSGWSRDGGSLLVSSGRRTPDAMDCWLIDVASGEWHMVTENQGTGSFDDLSRNRDRAIVSRVEYRGDGNLFLIELQGGREQLFTPHDPPAQSSNGRFSPDGRTVYLITDVGRDLSALARISIGDDGSRGEIEVMAERQSAEVLSFELSADGSTAVLILNVAGTVEISFVDLETGRETRAPSLPAEIAMDAVFSPDGRFLAMTVSGSTTPTDIWLLDRDSGSFRQVTFSPHPGVRLETLVKPSLVRFSAHDGLELSGWLFRPHGAHGPGPMVLDFHGGPEGQAVPSFRATYQALLARGIGVFAPNVRGSTGFGKHFMNLDNGALRVDAVRDILACVECVVRTGAADPKRVGISGGSYGGYMTMAGLVEYPDHFAAGANLFGIVNFETFFEQTEPWMAAISKVEYGDPETERDLLRDLSPIHRIDRVRAPTMVLHGANDTNVPVVEAEQVVASLEERGVPVEYVLFEDEGHGFLKTVNKVRSTAAIVSWFEKHL